MQKNFFPTRNIWLGNCFLYKHFQSRKVLQYLGENGAILEVHHG